MDRNAVKPGTHVIHQTYGAGVIKEVTDKAIIIKFDKVRQKEAGYTVLSGKSIAKNTVLVLKKYRKYDIKIRERIV